MTRAFSPFQISHFTKRRAFFSFHFDDVMRVNNVRQAWRTHNQGTLLTPSFIDSSLWESKKLEAPESIKALIRSGVQGTSAVCVLVGTDTWSRRWVRYEIARSIIDGKGLLAVHLNRLRHHKTQCEDILGINPLDYIAVGKVPDGSYYLFEKNYDWVPQRGRFEWSWDRYADYQQTVTLPKFLPSPAIGYVSPLSSGCPQYCYVGDNGYRNIGSWIDDAAANVGR
ncbi:MAG: TIR domain-containing protein [Cohaesibacter sp.]|nr:TIR domain-containing protein [Cohaesibacter sp.]